MGGRAIKAPSAHVRAAKGPSWGSNLEAARLHWIGRLLEEEEGNILRGEQRRPALRGGVNVEQQWHNREERWLPIASRRAGA
jgi:hypothetical protein